MVVQAPLLEPRGIPLFVRAGAVIPTQDRVEHLEDMLPPRIILEVYPAGGSTWTMEEGGDRRTVIAVTESGAVTVNGLRAPTDRFAVHVH